MDNNVISTVLLGECGVGKSSILTRFCLNDFVTDQKFTLMAAFMDKTIEVKGNKYKFQVWDTAGQEKYGAIMPLYYKNAQAALIVYDISNRKSFERLKFWVEQLKKFGPANQYIVIVGNKIDKISEEKVTKYEANAYAKELGVLHKLSSCKDNTGITEIFESIALQEISD